MMPHPVVRLVFWAVSAGVAQFASGPALALLVAVFVGATVVSARDRWLRLLRRSRWLLIALLLLFAWATPGVLLLPNLASLSPTVDGLLLGVTHLGRLVVLLASLALLLQVTTPEELVGAFFKLLAPLSSLGVDRGRIAVRLLLVIEYVESARLRNWRDWLEPSIGTLSPKAIVLRDVPLSARDGAALFTALVLGALFACAP